MKAGEQDRQLIDNDFKKAEKLIRTPLRIYSVLAFCWTIFAIWGYFTDHGYYAHSFINTFMQADLIIGPISVISFAGFILAPIPCFVMSIQGSRLIARAAGSGDKEARKLHRLGFIALSVSFFMTIVGFLIIPLGGAGV